jgi:hypothetical protein
MRRRPPVDQLVRLLEREVCDLKEANDNMANDALVADMLDLMVNDSENLERTMNLLTDDAVWVLEPGGIEYHGAREIGLDAATGRSQSARRWDARSDIGGLGRVGVLGRCRTGLALAASTATSSAA